jgi:hypothetical protein
MSEFKSQAEVWQALLDGKTVYEVDEPHMTECYKIINGTVMYKVIYSDMDWAQSNNRFHCYKSYGVYTDQKPKKIVRMAPALVFADGYYFIGGNLYSSEKSAINYHARGSLKFVKWLIDTPYAIEVEVDDEP